MPDEQVITQGMLEDVVGYILVLVQTIRDWIGTLVSQAVTWVTNLVGQIATGVGNLFASLRTWLADLFTGIVTWLQQLIQPIVTWLQAAWEAIYDLTVRAIQEIAGYVSDILAWIRSVGEAIIAQVTSWIESATAYVGSIVDAVISGILQVVDAAKTAVVGFVSGIVTQIGQIIAQVVATIQAAWSALVTGAEAIITTIGERLIELRSAFADAATEVVGAIAQVGEESLGPIRDGVKRFVEFVMPGVDPERTQMLIAVMQGTRTDPAQMEIFRQWWHDGFRDLAKRGGLYQTVFFFLFTVLSLIPAVWGIGQVLTKVSLQEWNARFPSELLPPADAAAAWRHGFLDERQAVETIKRQGYTEADANTILRITETVPPEADLVAMKLRGLIPEAAFESALKLKGYSALWAARYSQAAEIIPPVQDLITMAIRDVWNPAAVALGQLTEGFPKEVGEWSAKHGLSADWAAKYWAAHWSLPSPQQGFEMLHRGVIDAGELDTLLQALDIAPGWRPRLTAIAFNPYTRVDIRRMHQLKILTDEQVYEAHLELGYAPDKARRLTDFVLSLNRSSVTEDDVELGRLSRSAILGFYEDGVIRRETAARLLQDLGHTLEAANLYLDAIDMSEQRSERKAQADLIIEQAEAGTITFEEAQDRLRGLGLETVEVEKAIAKLLRAAQRKVKLPSQADGESLYVKSIIPRGEYEDLLSRLGYAPKWRTAYVQLAEKKKSASQQSGRG